MLNRDIEMLARIEAALYAAGRPLSVEELQKAAGTDSANKAIKMARGLGQIISSSLHALELIELQDGSFVLQLKLKYNNLIRKFATRPFLSHATLKTLSCLAYMQPVTSKQLVEIRGSQVYGHLKLLTQSGFLTYQKLGRLKIYQTTKKFQDYFGIDGDVDKLKKKLLKKEPRSKNIPLVQPILERTLPKEV
ncbi:MAG: SMC-Scp complex subunit ScpB [Nitrososphaerales archaeon]